VDFEASTAVRIPQCSLVSGSQRFGGQAPNVLYSNNRWSIFLRNTDKQESVVGIVEGPEFEYSRGTVKNFLHVVQTGSGAHPASYTMGTGASFSGG
jgi:hypothetical protein